jgi:hypothetical protein
MNLPLVGDIIGALLCLCFTVGFLILFGRNLKGWWTARKLQREVWKAIEEKQKADERATQKLTEILAMPPKDKSGSK